MEAERPDTTSSPKKSCPAASVDPVPACDSTSEAVANGNGTETNGTPVPNGSDQNGTTEQNGSAVESTQKTDAESTQPDEVNTSEKDSGGQNGDIVESSTVPSAEEAKSEDKIKEAEKLFLQGKRDLKIRDYAAAVSSLSEACELYTAIYGELADELGDVYLQYGKALFLDAQSQSHVLGDQINKDGSDDEEEDEEDAEDTSVAENEATSAEKKTETDEKKSSEEAKSETDVKEKTDGSEAKEKSDPAKTENASEPGPSTSEVQSSEVKEEEDENEEADDLQLSWQILEMAKVVFERGQENKEIALKLSEVYLTLGENCVESERYEAATADMLKSLELMEKHLNPDDRLIAENLYQLGVAHALNEDYDNGISYFKKSIEQLGRRQATLEDAKKNNKTAPDGEERDSFYSIDGELTEIENVIKEIQEKIADTEESKKVMQAKIVEKLVSCGFEAPAADGASSSAEKPVNNIGHLIKKRKIEDEVEGASVEKKVKTAENGQ